MTVNQYDDARSNVDEATTMVERGEEASAQSYALIGLTQAVLALVDELHCCRVDALDIIRNGGLS